MKEHKQLANEVKSLREREDQIHEKSSSIAKQAQDLKVEIATLEKIALQLQQKRLRIIRQRIESRYIFDVARRLETSAWHQQWLHAGEFCSDIRPDVAWDLPLPNSYVTQKEVKSF